MYTPYWSSKCTKGILSDDIRACLASIMPVYFLFAFCGLKFAKNIGTSCTSDSGAIIPSSIDSAYKNGFKIEPGDLFAITPST